YYFLSSFSLPLLRPPVSPLFPYTTLFRSVLAAPGDWGVPNFRIPALAVAPNGDLLAAFDKRPVHGDSPAPNSIWQRRSRDGGRRSEEHTSELQSRFDLVCRLLLEKKKI